MFIINYEIILINENNLLSVSIYNRKIVYYKRNSDRAGIYVKGLKQGLWKDYFIPSGKVAIERNYLNDKKHGMVRAYDENGNIYYIKNYI